MILNHCDFKYRYLSLSIVIYPFCFVLKIRMLLDIFLYKLCVWEHRN